MDSTRLLAPGVPIQVSGGELTLRFDLLALKRLEDAFGTISKAEERVLAVCRAELDQFPEAVIGDLGLILGAGTGQAPQQILAGMDLRYDAAIDALWEAWCQAWPSVDPSAEGKAAAPADGTGVPSTTPRPSGGVEVTSSSGTPPSPSS